jgi:Ca2+-binding EF-hand superfamily protein
MRKQIAIVGSIVVMAGSAFAGEQATDSSFKNMDTNKDGYLSQGEVAADDTLVANFMEYDTNRDGLLSSNEYEASKSETEEGE